MRASSVASAAEGGGTGSPPRAGEEPLSGRRPLLSRAGGGPPARRPASNGVGGLLQSGGGKRGAWYERRLTRRLERPPGRSEGWTGSLEGERAESVAVEVAVAAGRSLLRHSTHPRGVDDGGWKLRFGRGLTDGDPMTTAAGCKCLSTQKTRSFRAFRNGQKPPFQAVFYSVARACNAC